MSAPQLPPALRDSVQPVRDGAGTIVGTAVTVGPGLVLTALLVVDPDPVSTVGAGHPVGEVVALPARGFGSARALADRSYRRSRVLTGDDLGTVDLALLRVDGPAAPPVPLRGGPVRVGDRIAVAGYPGGWWTVTFGVVTGADESDFRAHMVLGPGASGAPAFDGDGRLAGVVTLDHADAGAIIVGTALLGAFVPRAARLVARRRLGVDTAPAQGCAAPRSRR